MRYTHALLRILNRPGMQPLPFLVENLDQFVGALATTGGQDQFFNELALGFEELSAQHQSAAVINSLKAVALSPALQGQYAALVGAHRDAIGYFLVELMRMSNFTLHDSQVLRDFRNAFTAIGIQWAGQPDACIQHATFATLGYDNNSGTVITTIS